MFEDTIVAIATPPGRGGVGIVRLSGPKAYTIATLINGTIKLKPRVAVYSSFYVFSDQARQLFINEKNLEKPDLLIDQGLMIYFKGPNSFTGEDIVEIHAHGSPIVLDYLIETSIHLGARLARPGEFSERAFLNGKIDLTQAEAIADLIHASTKVAAQMALKSLQGVFSTKINQLNKQIIFLRTYVESAIDFPEEEIDFLSDGKVAALLQNIIAELDLIRSEVNQGMIVREGLSVVIAGRPNAGKSTLINCFAGRDVAIVTEIAGTTRDVMKEYILLDDIPVHIIDTAGLRDSNDLIEKEGIKRAWDELKQADCVLLVIDVNDKKHQNELEYTIAKHIAEEVPIIRVYNKIDILNLPVKISEDCSAYISAKSGHGIDYLKKLIKRTVGYQPNEGTFLARRRHLESLDRAREHLIIGQEQLKKYRAGELLAEDLRIAHRSLCEITGEFTSEDLLGQIFSSFCIGK